MARRLVDHVGASLPDPREAKKKAAITAGLVVSTRARFRSTAALETTDDARFHDVTQAQPPRWNGPSLRNP
ncbi:hypothetical protein [Streptomyces coeruleorubidus]